ncbi:protease domain protein [Mycobacterium kansasii]|uniref:Protease domain protein n=1 Tax=Mycobacterium kansasii TaxID=1768 RepID=A0A1V3WC30_MYCKA|nr:protease domain protein [Mycobacterium kansasii]
MRATTRPAPRAAFRPARRCCQRDDRLADRHPATDRGGGQTARTPQLQHRDVLGAVVADHVDAVGLAVTDVERADVGGARNHVVVGQHDTVGIDDDAGAGSHRVVVAQLGVDVDDLRPDLGDQRRRVERQRRVIGEPVQRECGRRRRCGRRRCGQTQSEHGQYGDQP